MSRPTATRYYLGQPVESPADLPLEWRDCGGAADHAWRGGVWVHVADLSGCTHAGNAWVRGVEFHDDGARRECDVKMDALKDERRCARGTEGCVAKHKAWRMWGPQLRPGPWA